MKPDNSQIIVYHNHGEIVGLKHPHLHTYVEILYNIHGCKSFFADGKYYKCEGNDLFIIPPTTVHKAVFPSEVYDRCIIDISAEIINALLTFPFVTKEDLFLFLHHQEEIPCAVRLDEKEHIYFMKLVDKYNAGSGIDRLCVLVELLCHIKNCFKKAPKNILQPIPDNLADEVILYIENHLYENITVFKISNDLYISESPLCREFKKITGLTVKKYITARKIAETCRLLYMGYSAKEAAAKLNFKDYTSFIRTFKNETNTTPKAFKELNLRL